MNNVSSSDGTTIAYDRSGTGPAIILVGGAFQHRAIDPRTMRLAELLARRFTVFHYDRRGRGESGDTTRYAVEREVDDIAAMIEAAGGNTFVFGTSSGAVLALEAAARGLAISRLALYEPPFMAGQSRTPLPPDYVARLTALVTSGRSGDAVASFLTTGVGLPADVVVSMRERPFWPAFEAVAHTLAYDAAIVADGMSGRGTPLVRWANILVSTLVIDGGQTPWMSRGADAICEALPHATRRTLHGQPHGVNPEVLAPALEEFFNLNTPRFTLCSRRLRRTAGSAALLPRG